MRACTPAPRLLHRGLAVAVALLVTAGLDAPVEARPIERSHVQRTLATAPPLSRDHERVASGSLAGQTSAAGWTGFAFDACRAPSQRVMDRWRARSPFLGVGVYIGGSMRACAQPHLTRGWVSHQLRAGWKLLPIWVGPQASCSRFHRRIDRHAGSRGLYPGAHRQGIAAARGARAAARALGIPGGSTLWYDIEAFAPGSTSCRRSSLRFLSSWTRELHRSGYRAGVYSSVSAAVKALATAPTSGPRGYASPDHVWFAWANRRADSWLGRWVHAPRWKQHRRVHQYALNVSASYGGVRLQIDQNFVDLGGLSAQPLHRVPGPCGSLADRRAYPPLWRGRSGPAVEAAQCLLRFAGHRLATSTGRYDASTRAVVRAVQGFRRLPRTGRTDRATWTALLATGTRPVLKRGTVGPPVRRLQRALTAALPGALPVTGFYGGRTGAAVRSYQARVGLRPTGVVAAPTWSALAHGKLSRRHHHRAQHVRRHQASHPGAHHPRRSRPKHHAAPHRHGKHHHVHHRHHKHHHRR
jgi:hypothetical protein